MENHLGFPDIKPLRDSDGIECIKKIEPGLSSVEGNPDEASRYIGPLMDFISQNIPEGRHNDTQIHILATAGMRLLGNRTQHEIMSDLENDLPKQYRFTKIKARVLSGQEEGVYSWVAINFKAHRFNDNSEISNIVKSYEKDVTRRTIGIIEMGGASAQVAFELDIDKNSSERRFLINSPELAKDSIKEVDLSRDGVKHTYKLFVNTFLGVGVNSAREAAVDLLVETMLKNNKSKDIESVTSLTLLDPCLPKDAEEIVQRPKGLLSRHPKRKTIGIRNDENGPNIDIILKGSGSMKQCMVHLTKLIDVVKEESMNCDSLSSCPMALLKTDFIPFDSHEFYGLSEFFYSTDELINSAGPFNRGQIISRTNQICLSTLSQLQSQFPYFDKHKPSRILHECFKATWIITFLEHGLNMPKQYSNFKTVERIDGEEIDWTLGAVIEKSTDLK